MNSVREMAVAYLLGGSGQDNEMIGLKDAAKGLGVHIGSAINYWHVAKNFEDQTYIDTAKMEYDLITAESNCKMKPIAKDWNNFDYSKCDGVLDFAQKNNMVFRGHAALWAKDPFYPDFVKQEKSASKIEDFMQRYIKSTIGRYKGKVWAWDVVNEAITDRAPYQVRTDTPWAKVDDFICKAFKWAHQADPQAQLFYNDYGHSAMDGGWYGGRGDAIYNMIKEMKNKGCPIDGVGFQLHEDVDFGSKTSLIAPNLKRYKDIGIKVHFTEIDVKCRTKNGKCVAWNDELLQLQGDVYYKLLHNCLSASNCESFETWGLTDKYTWLAAPYNPLPFDKDFNKKNAYYSLRSLLKKFPRDHEAVIERNKRRAEDEKKRLALSFSEDSVESIQQEQFLY